MRHSFNLKQTALIAAIASAYPLQAFANAGVTQFSVGEVSVQRATANTPLASGSRIESGDLITTGNTGRTQLRFTDGGMVSLQPNSQFKISRYADANDGKQDSFLVDLARGGMRAITGLIGKRNRDNYKVTTSTATIGIRGSGFSMAYNNDGSLSVTTELDAIEVCTQEGCIGLNLGESALVTSANALPRRVDRRAVWNPPNPRRLVGARNDDVDSEGKTANIPRQVFTNLAFTGAGLAAEDATDIRGYLNGAALVEGGVLKGYRAGNNDQGDSGTVTELARSGSMEAGNFMLLGSWTNSNWSGTNAISLQQSAFVIGQPSPQAAVTSLAGMQARYNLTSGSPVYSAAGNGTILSTSHVLVDFRSAFANLDMNLDISMPVIDNPIFDSISATIGNGHDGLYNLRGSATATTAGFRGTLSITDTNPPNFSSGPFAQAVDFPQATAIGSAIGTGEATGFFGGPQAGTLGLSFTGNTYSHGAIAGAGVFSSGAPIAIPETSLSNYPFELHVLDGNNNFYADNDDNNNSFSMGEGSAMFSGTQLTRWEQNPGTGILSQQPQNATPTRLYGSVGQPNDPNFLGWGSWAAGTFDNGDGVTNLNDVHYVVGKPTTIMPYFGVATYGLIGGTIPTSSLAGNGQLVNGSMSVDFSSSSLTATIGLKFGNTTAGFTESAVISGSTFRTTGCGNNFFSGFFSGDNAARAGMVYGINGHSTLGNIRGAAAFRQTSITYPIPQ